MNRSLGPGLLTDLLCGNLYPLLQMVHEDTTLDMQLRGEGVSIYYRGGKLFEVISKKDRYEIKYNAAYWYDGDDIDKKYANLLENPSIQECVEYKSLYKDQMDYHISKFNDPSAEAQVQQRIVLENNTLGKMGDKTGDYYILDTEYVFQNPYTGNTGKFDAVALRWPTYTRRNHKDIGISIIEIKNGDDAISGGAGIVKHIKDFCDFVSDSNRRRILCDDMQKVFHQKCELGLIPRYTEHYQNDQSYLITIDDSSIDMVFILANRNPMGSQVKREFSAICRELSEDDRNKIFISTASDMGYVLFRYVDKEAASDRYIPLNTYLSEL